MVSQAISITVSSLSFVKFRFVLCVRNRFCATVLELVMGGDMSAMLLLKRDLFQCLASWEDSFELFRNLE